MLRDMVDFDRLNSGQCRFTATAFDPETGEDVVFDSRDTQIAPEQVRASAALPVLLPPVQIGERWLVDGGISANLPLDPVFAEPPARPTLCLAVDLLPLRQRRPATLGEAASRTQDLVFAAQSRRTIVRWRDAYAGRQDLSVTLVRLAYTEQSAEIAGKAMDFSGSTVRERRDAGRQCAEGVIARLESGEPKIGLPGLHILEAGVFGAAPEYAPHHVMVGGQVFDVVHTNGLAEAEAGGTIGTDASYDAEQESPGSG